MKKYYIKKELTLLLCIIVLFLFTRFFLGLDKDPFYVSNDEAAFVDSGIYTFNVKHKLNHNVFNFEEYNYHLIYPVYNFIIFSYFKIVNFNYKNLIILSILINLLSLILLFYLFFNNKSAKAYLNAIFISVLFSSNVFLVYINRSGLIENMLIPFFIIFLFLWLKTKNKYLNIFAGIILYSILFIKLYSIILLAAFLSMIIFEYKKTKKINQSIKYILLGISIGFFISILYFIWKSNDYKLLYKSIIFKHIFKSHLTKNNILYSINSFFHSNLFIKNIFVYTMFLIGSVKLLLIWNKKSLRLYKFVFFIFIFNFLFAILSPNYFPLRYRIFSILTFFILTINAFNIPFIEIKKITKHKSIIFIACYFWVYPVMWYVIYKRIHLNLNYYLFVLLILYFSFSLYWQIYKKRIRFQTFKFLLICLLLSIAYNTIQTMIVYKKTQNNMKSAFNTTKKIIKPNSTVIGWWAPQLCFNLNNINIIPGKPYPELLKKYNPDFIFLTKNEINYISKKKYIFYKKFNFKTIKTYVYIYKKKIPIKKRKKRIKYKRRKK